MQLGLLFTWATLCVDSYQDWRYIKAVWVEEEIPYLMTIIIIFAILLSLSIGSLFVTQILGLIRNITTLESFIPNIEGSVVKYLFSLLLMGEIGECISPKSLAIALGFCPLLLIYKRIIYDDNHNS
jgi:hypothetical protein